MRKTGLLITFGAMAALLFGCAGSQNSNPLVSSASPQYSRLRSPAAVSRAVQPAHAKIPRDLYIADYGANAVDILRNKTYRDVGTISLGWAPVDVFLDARGNLYVVNYSGTGVAEYAPRNTSSYFIYSSGLALPNAVTTDDRGDVFVGDSGGNVTEYFQGVNEVAAQCYTNLVVEGVAVDSYGDVFVDGFNSSGSAVLVEYSLGLSGCGESYLAVQVPSTSNGIALDKNHNLLVAAGSEVAVIPPPFEQISRTIGSGFSQANNVRLNRANTEAFVSDYVNKTVTIVSYPGGSNIRVLGTQNGLTEPASAVAWPNAVY